MSKRKLFITLLLCVLQLFSLTACSVAFPKSADKLLSHTTEVWGESISSVIDTYKISKLSLAVPVQISGIGDKILRVNISDGEISVERIYSGGNLQLNLAFAGFNVIVDNQLKIFLESSNIDLSKFDKVNGKISLLFLQNELKATIAVNNMHLVYKDYPPIYSREDTFSGDEYNAIYKGVQAIGFLPIFGSIPSSGKLDKNTNSYSYTLAKESVHGELLKLPKLLIDAVGGKKFEGANQTLHDIMTKYFGSTNIIDIANTTLTAKDIKVICLLGKTDKRNYISKLSGNYMGQGALAHSATELIFKDFASSIQRHDDILKLVTVTGGMTITANLAISSQIILK